ncbi:MAG TPA: histidinol-phosphatase HisJ family protein [Candidatus Sumerlaeota bacterium]|nr:histidinol-phosphatase HisJ family protein [Candidatus Sumerlaeota bacterium]
MLIDYHSHTWRCRHAHGAMEQYVQRAIALGFSEFGFSDHSPWMIQARGEHVAMAPEELPDYVADVQALRRRFNSDQFTLRLGLEMDYVPSRRAIARRAIEQFPWDYLIGSVHHLGFWGLPKPSHAHFFETARIEDVCELYYHLVGEMIDEGFCDIIAHLDLPGKFGHFPPGGMVPYVEPLIPRMLARGTAVEINTSGVDAPCAEVQPGWDVLALLADAHVPLLVNSDAHQPEHIGRHFPETLSRLRDLGVRTLTRFEARRRIEYPLPEPGEIARLERALQSPQADLG